MRTRRIHLTDVDTVFALAEHCKGKTRRAAAVALGLPESSAAMLSDVLKRKPGALSVEGEADLRRRLGLPIINTQPVPICPIHGEPHIADCHGAPVAAVVTLAPGERVSAPRKPAVMRTLSDYPPAVLAWQITHRETFQP